MNERKELEYYKGRAFAFEHVEKGLFNFIDTPPPDLPSAGEDTELNLRPQPSLGQAIFNQLACLGV